MRKLLTTRSLGLLIAAVAFTALALGSIGCQQRVVSQRGWTTDGQMAPARTAKPATGFSTRVAGKQHKKSNPVSNFFGGIGRMFSGKKEPDYGVMTAEEYRALRQRMAAEKEAKARADAAEEGAAPPAGQPDQGDAP